LDRPKEAIEATQMALAFDPNDSLAHTAEAQAHLQMENWPLAERSARQALALDADNSGAANQLAQALRLQNKLDENAAHLAGMLARDPEDAFTHANAGWAALQRGLHRDAELHFREALRLDPDFEYAREGLLTSFRARSWLYRGYLRYTFAMARLNRKSRWAVIIGLYLTVRFAGLLPGGWVLAAIYFLFVLWVWVARPVGNALLLLDRFARYALRRGEKMEAALVTSCLTLGIACIILSLVAQASDTPQFSIAGIADVVGIAGIAIAFPLSLIFNNVSALGRWIFSGLAILAVFSTGLAIGYQSRFSMDLFFGACIACAASTWLGNIRALYRRA
jgi:hypothetical protein